MRYNKIDLFKFTMTSNSINFDGTKTNPGEIYPFFTGSLRSLFFRYGDSSKKDGLGRRPGGG